MLNHLEYGMVDQYIKGWERKRSKCFFTDIHLDFSGSHHSIYTTSGYSGKYIATDVDW